MAQFYDRKMIKSGNVIEVFEYERPIKIGEVRNENGRRSEASEDDKIEYRRQSMSRAKSHVRRLINANINAWGQIPKFLTLTFAENITDLKLANYEFKKFRQRLEYQLNIKLKYLVVVEFQKRGAVHYHALFFNLPYIGAEKLASVWKNGFIKVNAIEQVDNIGAYVTKYMTKDEYDKNKEDKLTGEKSYFTSRGLNKPLESFEKKEIEQLGTALSPHLAYEVTFENDYLGKINYKQYNIQRRK